MLLNQETFEHRYKQLVYLTKKKGSEPSFTSGFWFDEEGYKIDGYLMYYPDLEHSNVSDVICGGSASAMIAYVGNQSGKYVRKRVHCV